MQLMTAATAEPQAGDIVYLKVQSRKLGVEVVIRAEVLMSPSDTLKHTGVEDRCFVSVEPDCGSQFRSAVIQSYGLPQSWMGLSYLFPNPKKFILNNNVTAAQQQPKTSCGSSDQGLFLSGAKRYTNAPRDPNSGLEWL